MTQQKNPLEFSEIRFSRRTKRRALYLTMRGGFFMLRFFLIVLSLLIFFANAAYAAAWDNFSDQARQEIENRIKAGEGRQKNLCKGDYVCNSVLLPKFYASRSFRPAWMDDKNIFPQAEALIRAIREATRDGLNPEDYHLKEIQAILQEIQAGNVLYIRPDKEKLIDLDLLLTDAFLLYGSHLLAGRVDPEKTQTEWFAVQPDGDLTKALQYALDTNEIEKTLQGFLPPQAGYRRLRDVMALYREIVTKGGWSSVPEGPKLKKGSRSNRIPLLRARLTLSGDLDPSKDNGSKVFDGPLQEAVIKFQRRHGLTADGTLGTATLEALNVSADQRLRQIELNLERWRWLPNDLGRRRIVVNIANFDLDVFEDEKAVLNMKVIVGTEYQQTPVFSGKMTYLEFNPYWNVPHKIAKEELLPKIKKNPAFLEKERIRVFQIWNSKLEEINPKAVDWSRVTAEKFRYMLRQDPGPYNPLGQIKFMFPNRFDVYLHDTNTKNLFRKSRREFSHGCIRIEKPIELAKYVLKDDSDWSRKKILETAGEGKRKIVKLPEPIPVHVLYFTAWADENGSVHFREDSYGRDEMLEEVLFDKTPNP